MKKKNYKNKIAVGILVIAFVFSMWIYNEKFGEEKEIGEQATDFTLTVDNIFGTEIDGDTIHVSIKLKANVHAIYTYTQSGTRSGSTTCCGATSTWTANYSQLRQYLYKTLYLNTIPSPYTQSTKIFTFETDIPNFIRSGEDYYIIDINDYDFGNKVQVYSYSLTPYAVCVGCSQDVRWRVSETGAKLTGQDPSLVKFYQDGSRTSSIIIRSGDITILSAPEITNFQQTQIDLTHEKVTFNTDVTCVSTYYLKIGGSWHLQNTGSNTTNHNYTFIVGEYTPTEFKVVATNQNGITTERIGTIRTVSQEICGDGIDNDNNGLTDWDDPACTQVTITKKHEEIRATTYYGIFLIIGDAEAYIEYQKGSGTLKTVSLTKVGQDYVLSLENLDSNSGYNGIIYAKDINFPENNDNIPLTFTTLQEGGIIEVTEEVTTSDSFNCKFKINANTINTLTFTYRTPYGSIIEVDPNDQGNNNYAVSITNLSAGDYEYIIETSTDKGDDHYDGTFTIAEALPVTTTPPPTGTPSPTTIPPSPPQKTDYTVVFFVLVVLVLVGVIVYLVKFKKQKKKRRK